MVCMALSLPGWKGKVGGEEKASGMKRQGVKCMRKKR